jgi:hypothetical protein
MHQNVIPHSALTHNEEYLYYFQPLVIFNFHCPKFFEMLLSSPNMILHNKVFSGGNNKVSENELLLILHTYIHTLPSL